jgi:hypothetical protein
MGNPLSKDGLDAFSDELVKEAILGRVGEHVVRLMKPPAQLGLGAVGKVGRFTKGFFGETGEAGKRFFNPLYGLKKGWQQMSPAQRLAELTPEGMSKMRHLEQLRMSAQPAEKAYEALKAQHGLMGHFAKPMREARGALAKAREPLKKYEMGAEHLYQPSLGLGEALKMQGAGSKARALAAELSRRGWTGTGDITKYLPVGQKGMTAAFGGMAIPDVVNAAEAARTGEGAALERGLGALGSVGGMVLGGGLGLVPGMALWTAAQKGGESAGRVLDRLRAGGSVGEAFLAPSPQEAQSQLQNIYKYYG